MFRLIAVIWGQFFVSGCTLTPKLSVSLRHSRQLTYSPPIRYDMRLPDSAILDVRDWSKEILEIPPCALKLTISELASALAQTRSVHRRFWKLIHAQRTLSDLWLYRIRISARKRRNAITFGLSIIVATKGNVLASKPFIFRTHRLFQFWSKDNLHVFICHKTNYTDNSI